MDGRDALREIEALLEREGKTDVLAELRRIVGSAAAAEPHAQSIAQVTRALLESEKTYRLVFAHELDPMSLFDPKDGRILDVNDAWVALYGYTREEASRDPRRATARSSRACPTPWSSIAAARST